VTGRGTVLVIGARPGSLGAAIAQESEDNSYDVYTAGISGEDSKLDVISSPITSISVLLMQVQPRHIVCTVGVNEPMGDDFTLWLHTHYLANVIGPMKVLQAWQGFHNATMLKSWPKPHHYVAISSNSARIARTNSMAYCASKSALSMALRVAAREASKGTGHIVYGYEPGWLAGTPMSNEVQQNWGGHSVGTMHRMPGEGLAQGVSKEDLAQQIVANLGVPGYALNGTLIGYDGGEQ
jgi:NAD(P)-dependent dehydrogenase (short-subunit alcohol dehydrogenase family)